jgi:hypothetical protein
VGLFDATCHFAEAIVGAYAANNTLKDPATTLAASIRDVGIDVTKTIAVAVAEGIAGPYFLKTISHDLHAVEKLVGELRERGNTSLGFAMKRGGLPLWLSLYPSGFWVCSKAEIKGISRKTNTAPKKRQIVTAALTKTPPVPLLEHAKLLLTIPDIVNFSPPTKRWPQENNE